VDNIFFGFVFTTFRHAFMKVGIPNGALGRSSFFNSVGYDIGGLFYNFSELENGILRGNKKAPGQFSVPFADRDPRKKLVLEKADPRIHFALNCGAVEYEIHCTSKK